MLLPFRWLAKELQAMQNQELNAFKKIVAKEISEMAKKEKYDLIINDGVMFVDDGLDITEKFLGRLREQAKSEKQ